MPTYIVQYNLEYSNIYCIDAKVELFEMTVENKVMPN